MLCTVCEARYEIVIAINGRATVCAGLELNSAICQQLNSVKLTLMLKCKHHVKLKLLNQLYSLLVLSFK